MSTGGATTEGAQHARLSLRGLRALALGVMLSLGCGHAQPPLHPPGPNGVFYVVREGDTLAEIAAREGIPLEDLAEINGMATDTRLEPGQAIFILSQAARASDRPPPATPPPAEAPPAVAEVPTSQSAFAWPLHDQRMSSTFGRRWGKMHEGIDLAAPMGTPVLAARDGVVLYAGNGVRGYGNMVVLQHDGDLLTAYAHASALLVKIGDWVHAGQEIARVGQTGHATAPHLHFEVRRGQVPQNPLRFLPPLPP